MGIFSNGGLSNGAEFSKFPEEIILNYRFSPLGGTFPTGKKGGGPGVFKSGFLGESPRPFFKKTPFLGLVRETLI